jgi:hypothetical protein
VVPPGHVADHPDQDAGYQHALGAAQQRAARAVGPAEAGDPGAPAQEAAGEGDDAHRGDRQHRARGPGSGRLADAALGQP